MAGFITIADFIFGCRHGQLSRVFTIDRQTYKVCCDCGAKFKYSLERMAIQRRFQPAEAHDFTTLANRRLVPQ